jgi:hypothetical protein
MVVSFVGLAEADQCRTAEWFAMSISTTETSRIGKAGFHPIRKCA